MLENAGFIVLKGNIFDSAVMKTSVISDVFRSQYLDKPGSLNIFEARAIVFEGPEDYHSRIRLSWISRGRQYATSRQVDPGRNS
jgi:dihydroxy-acid dehydratase